MLISFSVSNFRSFKDEQTLSLVASKRLAGSHDSHCLAIPDSDEKVLRAGVIYGANGAGKSNILAALAYARRIAVRTRKKSGGTHRTPFRFAPMIDEPSSFDLQFIAKNKHYRFGFSVDDEKILEEWLVLVTGNREKTIYERTTDANGKVEIAAPGLKNANEKLDALVTVGGRQHHSFLATVRATLEPEDFGEDLSNVLEWLNDDLTLIGPETVPHALGEYLSSEEDFRKFASDFLRLASTGVDNLQVDKKEISKEEFDLLMPKNQTLTPVGAEEERTLFLRLPKGPELIVKRTKEGEKYYRLTIHAGHQQGGEAPVSLDLNEESDGTRRLLDLLPALYHLRAVGAVYFVDEIDRSMHPMLSYKFLQYFLSVCTDTRCQIIVTTHESHLLDLDLLRRDEIWYAEKNLEGATTLYSLADFQVRKDLSIRKHYLEGRFGAIPFLNDIDRLMEEETRRAECP